MVEPKSIAKGFAYLVGILAMLYLFLVALDLLGGAFKIIAGDTAGDLFSFVENPVAGLMVGILATVLVQSSSTTTSIIVSAVGAGVLPVTTGIPMIFGANIGTSVTNTIVSIGFAGDVENYRRGFAGATVHDMFNYINVCIWFPLEVISSAINGGNGGILFLISEALASGFVECEDKAGNTEDDCEKWTGPVKTAYSELSSLIIKADKGVSTDFAIGVPNADECAAFCEEKITKNEAGICSGRKFKQKRCAADTFAVAKSQCDNAANEDGKKAKAEYKFCIYDNVTQVISVDQPTLDAAVEHYNNFSVNSGGIFFDKLGWDKEAGYVVLPLSIILLTVSLICMVKLLTMALRGPADELMRKTLNMNGYVAIVVGALVTMFFQSSSITTSSLTPLVAIGTLELESMLPLTVGANVGTTLTGVLSAIVTGSQTGFQIALVHVLFNIFGAVTLYPVPFIRAIPLKAARKLGDLAALYRAFPIFYILMLFFIYPGIFLGISVGYSNGGAGGIAGATFGLIAFIAGNVGFFFWYWRLAGRDILVKIFGREEAANASKVDPEMQIQ